MSHREVGESDSYFYHLSSLQKVQGAEGQSANPTNERAAGSRARGEAASATTASAHLGPENRSPHPSSAGSERSGSGDLVAQSVLSAHLTSAGSLLTVQGSEHAQPQSCPSLAPPTEIPLRKDLLL